MQVTLLEGIQYVYFLLFHYKVQHQNKFVNCLHSKMMVQMYTRYRWVDSVAYQFGHTVLHYRALDRAGNSATCDVAFEVVQCKCPNL